MIESIHIADTATYGSTPEVLRDLSQFNFIFGSNGSGKTTISRVIAGEKEIPSTCQVKWKGGVKLETLVYNRDFVERNFDSSTELKGIFTLGEKNIGTLEEIALAKGEYDKLEDKIRRLNIGLDGENGSGGKNGELKELEEEFKNKCWAQKQKYDGDFSLAFEGFRRTEMFKEEILRQRVSNSATLESLENLEKKARTVFDSNPTREESIPSIEAETKNLVAHESSSILKKRVIGKSDVDIAAMIQKLANSNWVKEGRVFYEENGGVCPFCQQGTTEAFAKNLNNYFDESFEKDCKSIDDLIIKYETDSKRLQDLIVLIEASPSQFLDSEKLRAQKDLLDSKIRANIHWLTTKRKEPSQSIDLESITDVTAPIMEIITTANCKIDQHNSMVRNLKREREDLRAQVWKYLLEGELKGSIADYERKKNGLNKAISGMTEQIIAAKKAQADKTAEIRALEKETTSTQPTIDGINSLLSSFGFHGFSLAKAPNGMSYKLVRPDGTDAKETLSEGERSFITFLYFYHLLKGSDSESGMTTDRVVVFDDPVSSLDSDILFVVASLIKGLFEEVKKGQCHIKQIFIFTHNVYFHKEVSYNANRKEVAQNEESFWIVRRSGKCSKLERHNSNPIKTSYDLLWEEVRRQDRHSSTIQNTLRRILENYFKILGNTDFNKICSRFEGRDRIICRSLFSWIHDGSHNVLDDICLSTTESTVDVYLKIFRKIFENERQEGHYKMMMGDAYSEIETVSPPQ
jgi:wobble nucleotide-excising tRNase